MNILLLGDVMGPSGRKAITEELPKIIKKKKIDFVIVNGENAGDLGVGITKKNFKITLPIIKSSTSMSFKTWIPNDPLYVSKFGILEPKSTNKEFIPDLIIVPLIAFDNQLNRIGYGKGYYDRKLKKIKKIKRNAVCLGIAYSFQKYKSIPVNRYDFKLDYIFTERKIISSNK